MASSLETRAGTDRTVAILVAAGKGLRAGPGELKQFRSLGGVPLLARSARPFIQCGDVLILDLHHVNVGDDVLRLARVVAAARLRIEVTDDLDVFLEILNRQSELAGDLRDLMVLQQPEVVGDDLVGGRPLEAEVAELQQQALLQIARGKRLHEITAATRTIAEGVRNTRTVRILAERLQVDMPIVEQMAQVLYGGKEPASG